MQYNLIIQNCIELLHNYICGNKHRSKNKNNVHNLKKRLDKRKIQTIKQVSDRFIRFN